MGRAARDLSTPQSFVFFCFSISFLQTCEGIRLKCVSPFNAELRSGYILHVVLILETSNNEGDVTPVHTKTLMCKNIIQWQCEINISF
jgi:hypothetical protein